MIRRAQRLIPALVLALAGPTLAAAAEEAGGAGGTATMEEAAPAEGAGTAGEGAASAESATGAPPGLFFTWPVFSDTPSPNTTLRLDYAITKLTDEGDALEHQLRLDGELAPVRWLGLGMTLPYTIADRDDANNRHNLDDVEVELKLAAFVLEDHGILLGGGMGAELPTGSSDNEIGSDRLVWLRPFVDAGLQRGPFEATSFVRFAFPVNENDRDPDWALAWNTSFLLHVASIAAAVLELDGERSWGGDDESEGIVNVSPGLRWNPADDPHLWFSTGVRIPVTNDDAFDLRWQISAFYHF